MIDEFEKVEAGGRGRSAFSRAIAIRHPRNAAAP
jgi:hypothetical protein